MANGNFLNYMWPFGSMTSNAPVEEQTTQDQTIKSPTSGYEMLDVTGRAQTNKLKKDAAMQALYEENQDQLGGGGGGGAGGGINILPAAQGPWTMFNQGNRPVNDMGYYGDSEYTGGLSGEVPQIGPGRLDVGRYNEPPSQLRSMRLEGEPYFAEGWRPRDILDRDTTIGGYQKFPEGDQWRNKDKYLRSEDYLSTLEPSHAGLNQDRKGFKFPSLLGLGLDALKDKFEYKGAEGPAWDYTGTGGWLTEEEQDQMNARGGYYSEAARKDRFQRQRVLDMMARKAAGKKISDRNFEELIKQGYGPKDGPIIGGDGTTGGQRYEGPPTSSWNPNITGSPTHMGAGPLHGTGGGQNRGPTGYTGGNRSPGHPSNRARGGYMRSGYSNGGRVGILAAF